MCGVDLPNSSLQRVIVSGNTIFLDGNLSCIFFLRKKRNVATFVVQHSYMTRVALIWTFRGAPWGFLFYDVSSVRPHLQVIDYGQVVRKWMRVLCNSHSAGYWLRYLDRNKLDIHGTMETNKIEEYFVEIPCWWQGWNADFLEVLNDFFTFVWFS